jgi:hypothetical protein
MRIHNLYTDASGQSHFRNIDVEWVEERRGSKLSKRLPATGIIFRETQAQHDIDWHPAPRRQYIINLDAGVKITASDGESRVIAAGEVIWSRTRPEKAIYRSMSRGRSGIQSSYRSNSADARRLFTAGHVSPSSRALRVAARGIGRTLVKRRAARRPPREVPWGRRRRKDFRLRCLCC